MCLKSIYSMHNILLTKFDALVAFFHLQAKKRNTAVFSTEEIMLVNEGG